MERRSNIFLFVCKQKFVHVLVFLLTVVLLFINLSAKTRAEDFTDMAHQTILADLIKNEMDSYAEDEQLIVETFDQEAEISIVQQSYLDNLSSFRAQQQVSPGSSDEEEIGNEDRQTFQNDTAIVKPDINTTTITKQPREGNVEYIVKPGDTISTIAEEYEVSVSTILWENDLSVYSILRPGDKLVILPMNGINHKVARGENLIGIATKYGVTEQQIIEANKLADSASLQVGQKLFVPGGKKPSTPSYQPTRYTGFSAIKDLVKSSNAAPAAGNKMNWPAAVKRISQYFSWRHYAVDIAGPIGTAIYAADAGVIEVAGWGTGYGNQIVIDHGGGKKTRYGHLSKFYVKKGAKVDKGQTIAAMGSTGWSTGSHVHFEVIIGSKKYDPLGYIK